MQSASSSSCDWAVYNQLHGRRAFSESVTRKIKPDCMPIPVKSTDFGGIVYRFFLPFLPSYRQPTDLPQSTDFYRFFRGFTEF